MELLDGGDVAEQRDMRLLEFENQLLEEFIAQAEAQGIVTQAAKKSKPGRRRKEAADAIKLPKLSDDEKGELVSHAVEVLQAAIHKLHEGRAKDIVDIHTLMEEVELRIRETKQQTYEFKRAVILGAEDAHTGKTNADKVLRFLQDSIHAKGVLVQKLALKNTSAKAAIAKLEAQLAHQEDMGEVLHLVDFEQLKIENQQHLERIAAKNKELLALKLSTGRSVQSLNDAKDLLARLTAEGSALRASLAAKQRELGGFDDDLVRTCGQSEAAAASFRKLRAQQKDAEQPHIMEYIKLKAHVDELSKQAADLARKLDVARTTTAYSSGGGRSSPGTLADSRQGTGARTPKIDSSRERCG